MTDFVQELQQKISNIFTRTIFTVGDESISLISILQVILWLLIVIFLAGAMRNFLKRRLLVRLRIDEGNREAIATIISYAIGTLGCLIVLHTNGLDLNSLAVVAGGLGIGIGFGLQDITKNFVSGLTLLFERTIKVGDFIEFDGMSGYVKEVSLRSMIIRTREGGYIVVPNSSIVDNRVLNWSYDNYAARIHIPVGVAYGSDTVVVTEVLLKSAYMEPSVLHEPAPYANFIGFGDSSLDFELWVWVSRIDREPFIRSSLNFIIEYNLNQQGITIPFPQRDLWLRNAEVLTPLAPPRRKGQELIPFEQPPLPEHSKPLSVKDLLRRVTYFEGFTDLEIRQLIEIGYRQRLTESQILFRENDPGNAFYIVLSGSVEVFVEKIDKHLTNLEAGQFFGELSLMLGIPRTATVRALEDTILFVINKNGFERLLHENPDLSEVIVHELGKYQDELSQRQKELRDKGLLDASEDDKNPVIWVRKRLTKLFSL